MSAYAQIQDLATTGDGAQLYFSSSYRIQGSNDPGYLKIYRYAEHGFELFREFQLTPGPFVDTNFFLAERPSVSADGQTVAFAASRNCVGGSHCVGFIYHQGWVARNAAADSNIAAGLITLSPNARFALVFDRGGTVGLSPAAVYDFYANTSVVLQNLRAIGDGRYAVADDGTVLFFDSAGAPVRWRSGVSMPLRFAATATQTRLSADALLIVYESDPPTQGVITLRKLELASGRDIVLASMPTPDGYPFAATYLHPTLTNDGRTVAYTLGTDLVVQQTDGGAPRRLLSAPEGFQDAVISGQGNVVYASTKTGRLLKIDAGSGAVTELSAAVPHMEITGGVFVPGALVDVALSSAPGDPTVTTDAGPAPIVSRSPGAVTFQIPWEAQPDSTAKLYVPGNPSTFEEVHETQMLEEAPRFFLLPSPNDPYARNALAAHQDFAGLITPDSPARGGEIVHFYFNGLGPVSPPIATGAVTPAEPLRPVTTPLVCYFHEQGLGGALATANILFAGLAPGFIGVDQVDVLIPPGLSGVVTVTFQEQLTVGTVQDVAQISVAP
jgi:uncharacterized protein (TIGR03437 family)